jgi:hypothetical protein
MAIKSVCCHIYIVIVMVKLIKPSLCFSRLKMRIFAVRELRGGDAWELVTFKM